jgi:hypothetical protein
MAQMLKRKPVSALHVAIVGSKWIGPNGGCKSRPESPAPMRRTPTVKRNPLREISGGIHLSAMVPSQRKAFQPGTFALIDAAVLTATTLYGIFGLWGRNVACPSRPSENKEWKAG